MKAWSLDALDRFFGADFVGANKTPWQDMTFFLAFYCYQCLAVYGLYRIGMLLWSGIGG